MIDWAGSGGGEVLRWMGDFMVPLFPGRDHNERGQINLFHNFGSRSAGFL